jgi:hypothetical protein
MILIIAKILNIVMSKPMADDIISTFLIDDAIYIEY